MALRKERLLYFNRFSEAVNSSSEKFVNSASNYLLPTRALNGLVVQKVQLVENPAQSVFDHILL